MLQFPRSNHSPRYRQAFRRNLFQALRGALALSLSAFMFLTSLSFTASAQQASGRLAGSGSDSGAKGPERDYFIITQGPDGDTVCRAATRAELLELNKISTANLGLHQITHVRREYEEKAHGDDAQGGDNDLPAHLTIILRATAQLESFPEAKAAFIRAAATWENQILSPVTIYLDADYGTTNFGQTWGSSTLGSTSSPSVSGASYQSVRSNLIAGASNATETLIYNALPAITVPTDLGDSSTVSVSSSIARAIGILDPTAQPTDTAARIGFNSNFSFDFDPTPPPAPTATDSNGDGIDDGKTDFEAVATHEIGHALGFTSRSGNTAGTSTPAIWDLFRFRTGTTTGTFTTAQRIMSIGSGTSGGDPLQFYFVPGITQIGLSNGGPSASTDNGADGNQSSHWKQRSLNGGVYIGIMDPRIPSGTRRIVTSNDTNALNIFGYNLDNSNPPPPPPPPPPAPGNDSFSAPQLISGCTGSTTGTNVGATRQTGEPSHDPGGNAGGGSVWYQWQSPSNGSVTIDTIGSDYDTMLGVYIGSSVGGLTAIVKNDDIDTNAGNIRSSVTFNATAGTIYQIAVDGWGGDVGNIKLNWTASNCQQATTVKLSTNSYAAGESSGNVAVTVTRSDTTAAANVDYATSDPAGLTACDVVNGVASSRCDYTAAVGTLRFAIGESSKTIFIPVVDDSFGEGTESFTITLSNPTGASLGDVTSATVTISDTEPTGANPLDGASSNPFFVRQQYIDFLGREPDAAGLQGWLNILNNCQSGNTTCDRIEVSSGFFRSEEFQSRGYFIFRFYLMLGRNPFYSEFVPDMAKLSGFLDAQQLEANKVAFVNSFAASTEFKNKYDGFTTPTAYVDALLQTAGLPNHPTRGFWINQLTNNNTAQGRADVLRGLVDSSEVYFKFYNQAFVVMQYFGYLRRDPDAAYLAWIQTMNQSGGDYRIMINGFMNSVEYRKRFGP
ncbi:MAG TPA: NF038122 family metalloprotease [Pyrinomonadaceae bacterium]